MSVDLQVNRTAGMNSDINQARHRVKRACEPCKTRKKKCNGAEPCATCERYEYDCFYEIKPRKRRRGITSSPGNDSIICDIQPGTSLLRHGEHTGGKDATTGGHVRSRKANSGTAFEQYLSQRLDSTPLSQKQPLSWNLGLGNDQPYSHLAITRIVSQDEMRRLADLYFATVHQSYGFLNKNALYAKLDVRWMNFNGTDVHDSVLCGVAALGSLFSGNSPSQVEGALVECAKTLLETMSNLAHTSCDQVAALILRTMYLRCTTRPHAAWLVSCTMMHNLEAMGITEDGDSTSQPVLFDLRQDLMDVQRLYWLARLLNTWIANEYGQSKVKLRHNLKVMPALRPEDSTPELLRLYLISELLDPDETYKPSDFESGIELLAALDPHEDAIVLSQSNLGLALYRQLRLFATIVSQATIGQIISLGNAGLRAVMRLSERRQPWWHVANVPFQFICALLVIDTKISLAQIGSAMVTLEHVAQCFTTPSIVKALKAAKTLVYLSQKRKQEEVALLGEGLQTLFHDQQQSLLGASPTAHDQSSSSQTVSLDLSIADLTSVDWDTFLGTNISMFEPGTIS